jgi:hypothetical protein
MLLSESFIMCISTRSGWVVRPGPSFTPIPTITQFVIKFVVTWWCDIQGFAAYQLKPGHNHVQFCITLVRMTHPQNVVLVRLHASKRQPLEIVHHLLLLRLRWRIPSRKRNHA